MDNDIPVRCDKTATITIHAYVECTIQHQWVNALRGNSYVLNSTKLSIYASAYMLIYNIDFNEVDMRIYLPEKVILTDTARPR